jgi:hypothetical protein
VAKTAQAISVSERQLARAFAAGNTSVAATVAEMRLQRPRELLRDRRRLEMPVNQIAFHWGSPRYHISPRPTVAASGTPRPLSGVRRNRHSLIPVTKILTKSA